MSNVSAIPWPSPARAWWMIFVFFVVAVLSYSDRLVLSLLVDPIRADLGLSDTEIGIVGGLAFAAVYSVAGLPFGRLADIFPRRMVIIAGVIIWSLCTGACAYAQNFESLFAARVGVGIGEAAFAPAAVSMIADSFAPNRRGLAIGFLLTGMAVGSGAAIVIGGGLLEAANAGLFTSLPLLDGVAPWRTVLLVLAVAGVLPVLLLLTLREPVRQEIDHHAAARNLTLSDVLRQFAVLSAILLPLYLGVAFVSAGDFAIQNWTPTMLSRVFGYTPGEIAQTLGIVSIIIGGAGTIFGGWLSDREAGRGEDRGRLKIAMLAAAIGLGGGAIAFAGNGDQAIACFALWIFMSSVSGAVGITVLQNIVPNKMRGVGTALVSFCNVILGLGVGTALTGVLTDHLYRDPMAVGLSMSTVAMSAGLLALVLFWRARVAVAKRERISTTA
ncbi:MAG TPA: MFS transporter [Verrucomicrobiae bacterium]|nr:MFS transporter [Verrucomicrobiae bacterium]